MRIKNTFAIATIIFTFSLPLNALSADQTQGKVTSTSDESTSQVCVPLPKCDVKTLTN